MPTRAVPDKRTRLVDAAARLVYEQGFNQTTLADIAGAADVPVGNVYYYFKTKEALGEAIVEQRLAHQQAAQAAWEDEGDARYRLARFAELTGADLEDTETLIEVWWALEAWALREQTG